MTANSTGGVMGKMIDAQSIVVATASTGQQGQEGRILRFVFWHSVALAAIMGVDRHAAGVRHPVDDSGDTDARRGPTRRVARCRVLVPDAVRRRRRPARRQGRRQRPVRQAAIRLAASRRRGRESGGRSAAKQTVVVRAIADPPRVEGRRPAVYEDLTPKPTAEEDRGAQARAHVPGCGDALEGA